MLKPSPSGYPWVRFFTPVNEIYVSAKMSAKNGLWNEQLKSDRAFVTAIKHLVAASTLANHRIARHRPDCVIIQSESAEFTHQAFATASSEIRLWNKLRFLALDLLYAHPADAEVCTFLLDNGMKPEEYRWNMLGGPPGYQVAGIDYYGHNERIALSDGTTITAEDVMGWYQIAKKSYARYKKPVMHTETNFPDPDKAAAWLWKQWINVLRMRESGVPVLGFTWYSLTDQIDWDIALAKKAGTVNPTGLYDLNRRPRPVAKAYQDLLRNFGRITIVPHGEMFEVTRHAATLKVEA